MKVNDTQEEVLYVQKIPEQQNQQFKDNQNNNNKKAFFDEFS